MAVQDLTDVADARRRVGGVVTCAGYDETRAGRVAIVVTEPARNPRRDSGGELLAGADRPCPAGVAIVAFDRRPGVADIAGCVRDGHSSTRRRLDNFSMGSGPAGTPVALPRRPPDGAVTSAADVARIVADVGSDRPFISATMAAPAVVFQLDASRRVVLTDDEETFRHKSHQMLIGGGPMRVQEAETGVDSLRLACTCRPDVVPRGARLPEIDGFERLDRLHADPITAALPVIVFSSRVLVAHQRNRPNHAMMILSRATLTREVMRRALEDIWLMGLPLRMREASE